MPAQAQTDTTLPRFESTACAFSNITRFVIDCGWLYVAEDHAHPEGATIRLAIAIIRSESADKQPDPIGTAVTNQFQSGYDINQYDPRGRFVYVSAGYKFK